MFTQCPNCQTVFRVTATMLKAAQGRVRCGRCAFVFNALTFLREPDDATAGEGRGESKTGAAKPAGSAAAPASAASQAQQKKHPADDEMRFDDNTGLADDDEVEDEDEDEDLEADESEDGEGEESEGLEDEIQVAEEIELAGDAGEDDEADESGDTGIELEGGGDGDGDGDGEEIAESELEFTADDLSKVFVLESAPTLPRPAEPGDTNQDNPPASARQGSAGGAVAADDDDETGQHEILRVEVGTPPSAEEITLEGDSVVLEDSGVSKESGVSEGSGVSEDSVVLEEEDPSVSGVFFVEGEAAAARTSAAETPGTDDAKPVAKKVSPTKEAIDAEVQREIEAAFAADPGTRAEFTLPSGKRMEIGGGAAPVETGAAEDAEDSDPHAELAAQQHRQRRVMLGWTVASGVLAFTFVLQLIHYNRQSLVKNAAIGPALASVYGAFGGELSPAWNLQAYELRQFGAAADADAQGTLRVRASLLNGAVHAQPYPVLRLTLQDRFGSQVGRRDLQPREYLHAAPSRNALIGAGQRIDADIAIVDPGKDAVGFEIDVCLPASAQGLTCAGEAGRNAS